MPVCAWCGVYVWYVVGILYEVVLACFGGAVLFHCGDVNVWNVHEWCVGMWLFCGCVSEDDEFVCVLKVMIVIL